MPRTLAYVVLIGLVGAGIVHIAILLMLPNYSESDAWSKLSARAPLYTVARVVGTDDLPLVTSPDPFFDAVACRFDLSQGIAHLSATGSVPFWSVSVYDRGGDNVYSFNDRTATDGKLDFVIATPLQMTEMRKALPPEFQSSVFVEVPLGEGIVLVRSFVPDPSWRPGIAGFLDGLACENIAGGE